MSDKPKPKPIGGTFLYPKTKFNPRRPSYDLSGLNGRTKTDPEGNTRTDGLGRPMYYDNPNETLKELTDGKNNVSKSPWHSLPVTANDKKVATAANAIAMEYGLLKRYSLEQAAARAKTKKGK